MFSIKELNYITLLQRHRSFSKAAAAANITQPALSAAISKIEARINNTLFYRDSHIVTPTHIGQYLAQRAQVLVGDVSELERDLENLCNKRHGSVRFGVGNIVADTLLYKALGTFTHKNRNVVPRFHLGYWYELRKQLMLGEISFFVTANHETLEDDELSVKEFEQMPICFYARHGHPILKNPKINCLNLIDYPLITYQTVLAKRLVKEKLSTEEQLRKFGENFPAGIVESITSALPLILNSDFMLMGPNGLFLDELFENQLTQLDVEDFNLQLSVKIVWRAKTVLSPLELDMIKALEQTRDQNLKELFGLK